MSERLAEIGEIDSLGEAYLAGELRQAPLRGEFRASRQEDVVAVEDLPAIPAALETLRAGEVVFGVLAAGASTRMSLDAMPERARRLLERSGRHTAKSKALVPVVEIDGRVLTFLDLFFENARRFSDQTGAAGAALLLLSEANAAEIEADLESHGRSGIPVLTFRQSLDRQIVATPQDVRRARKNFANEADVDSALDLAGRFAGHALHVPKPAGHGEFLHQLVSSGMLTTLLRRGVRYVSIRNIDNVGALLDARWLAILGRMIAGDRRFVIEVSRRPDGPAGKGGALIVRPDGAFQLAEDPSFAGTGVDPRDSYYINDATAILRVDYLFRLYETSAEEIRGASPAALAAIAERGRRKFPPLLDVKPVRLASGRIAGAFVRETNLWESTGVAPDLGVDAVAVSSVKDVEDGFDALDPAEQRRRALRVRFVATKKWEDYEGINAHLVPYLARHVLEGNLASGEGA